MSASTTAVIAAVAAQRRRYISHLAAAGATSAEAAVPAASLPRIGPRMLAELREQRVVLQNAQGLVYLDQARADAVETARHAMALKLIGIFVILMAVAALAGIALLAFLR
jgi:hypothetical protein